MSIVSAVSIPVPPTTARLRALKHPPRKIGQGRSTGSTNHGSTESTETVNQIWPCQVGDGSTNHGSTESTETPPWDHPSIRVQPVPPTTARLRALKLREVPLRRDVNLVPPTTARLRALKHTWEVKIDGTDYAVPPTTARLRELKHFGDRD